MATQTRNRFKATVVLSSDHAAIALELQKLERAIYHVLARVDNPRVLRDYLTALRTASCIWLDKHPHAAPWDAIMDRG
jgi:hypothetical protein